MAYIVQGNDVVKIRWYATLGAQASVITHHYLCPAPQLVGQWDLPLLLNQWAAMAAPLIKPCIATIAHFDGSSIQVVTTPPYSALLYSSQGAGNGTMTLDPLPTQVTGMISRRTDFAGRAYRGRIYMPFPTKTGSDTNGLPTITYTTLLSNYVAGVEPPAGITLTSAGKSILLDPVLRHKPRPAAPADTQITGHEYPLKFATQRRRGSYGKANFSPPMTVPT